MIRKLDYVRRPPSLTEFNTLIERVNEIIDKLNAKIEIEEVTISRKVKDFKFFNGEEQSLPYHTTHTISCMEDASKIFNTYTLTFKEMNQINAFLLEWKVVSLIIDVIEEVTEKEEKQETIFETVESVDLSKPIKAKRKRWKPKKTSRA